MPSVFLLRRTNRALLAAQRALFEGKSIAGERWICVGASHRLHDAVPQIAALRPDVIASDLRLLDGHALLLLRRLGRSRPRLLLLSAEAEDPLLLDALAAGAQSYWLDGNPKLGLVTALHACRHGRAPMSPALARQVLQRMGLPRSEPLAAQNAAAAQDMAPAGAGLSRSDQHLLTLVAQGLLEGEIAQCWQMGSDEIGRRLATVYAALNMAQALGGAVSMKL